MPSIHPHLTILRPSPTTVSFTVSTSSPPQSLASHLTHWLLFGTRILIASLIFVVLLSRYSESDILVSIYISHKINSLPWSYVLSSAAVGLFLVLRRFETGMLLMLKSYSRLDRLPYLIFIGRRITTCIADSWHPDHQYFAVLSPACNHSIHSYLSSSRHLCS